MFKTLNFTQFSKETLESLHLKEISKQSEIDDPALGETLVNYCSRCDENHPCPGHMGYISLTDNLCIIHPMYVRDVIELLTYICISCCDLPNTTLSHLANFKTLLKVTKQCSKCNKFLIKDFVFVEDTVTINQKSNMINEYTPIQIYDIFNKLTPDAIKLLGFSISHPKNLILRHIPVAATCIRQTVMEISSENPITRKYKDIITVIRSKRKSIKQKRQEIYVCYQDILGIKRKSTDFEKTLKQRLSGKDGTFRDKSLGKRINYSGRSVISPDPHIRPDEVGLPADFASKLLVKETYNTVSKQRIAQLEAANQIVHSHGNTFWRKSTDGDIMIINRQPTLQRMSVMAFKARFFEHGKTIRLNLAVTAPFNADFDGDEMNVFCVTSYMARAESMQLLDCKQCLISPQTNTPIIAPVQDTITGAYLLSKSARGRALLSSCFDADFEYAAAPVVITHGRLRAGLLTKRVIYALIHEIATQRGAARAFQFIDDIQHVVNDWLLTYGLSVGLADCWPAQRAPHRRLQHASQNEQWIQTMLDNETKAVEKAAEVQEKSLLHIIESGAKGSMTNFAQITSIVGQQYVYGTRPQKLNLYFDEDDDSPESRGFCRNSFSSGLNPSEFFFHCQAGREGLINTGLNTSATGYTERKIIKMLEDISIKYDNTVRNNNNKIFQFEF